MGWVSPLLHMHAIFAKHMCFETLKRLTRRCSYCEDLDIRVWHHCAPAVSEAVQRLGCVNHSMTEISPLLMLPHNASVLEVANA